MSFLVRERDKGGKETLCCSRERARERERQSVVATMSRGQLAFGLAWHVLPRTGLAWTGLGGDQQEAQALSLMMIIFSNFYVAYGRRVGCVVTLSLCPLPYLLPLAISQSLSLILFFINNLCGSVSCSLQHMCT